MATILRTKIKSSEASFGRNMFDSEYAKCKVGSTDNIWDIVQYDRLTITLRVHLNFVSPCATFAILSAAALSNFHTSDCGGSPLPEVS